MADMSVDTSSYPKPPALPAQKSLLDQVGQYQGLESNQLTIGKQKLDLMNSHFQIMNAELANMANDPSITPDIAMKRLNNIADTLGTPDAVRQQMIGEYSGLTTPQQVQQQAALSLKRGMAVQEKVNNMYGTPGTIDSGQTIQPVNVSPMTGIKSTGLPIQKQLSLNTQTIDNDPTSPTYGQPKLLGPQAPQTAPGSVASPTPLPPQAPQPPSALPVGPVKGPIQGPSSNFGGNVLGASVEAPTPNQTVQNRFPTSNGSPTLSVTPPPVAAPQASGPATGTPPMFEEGKKQLAMDQDVATQKLTGIKNAQKALALLPGVDSGPGTGPYQQALAFLKAQGIMSTDPQDKTVVYQEINKYLNRYVQQSGLSQRSDAAQALAENSNPNLMTQLNPALINLTRNAIALDKVEAARPNAFQGKDYSQYGAFRSSFPQSQDERAYGMSDLSKPEAAQLYQTMLTKAKAGDPEGIKFIKSLDIANKQGL